MRLSDTVCGMTEDEREDGVAAAKSSDTDIDDETSSGGRDTPRWVIHSLIVLASIVAVASMMNVWLDRQVLDTDKWVDASDELLADEDVRNVLSAYLVDELYESVDVAEELETKLPENLDGLAGPLAAALRAPATNAVDRLLGSEAVAAVWSELNRSSHETLVRVLKDETGPGLSTADGKVTLELGELVRKVGEDFGLSEDVLDKLPEDAGRVIIAESDELATAQDVVRVVQVLSLVFFFLVLFLYGLAIWLAGPRRRAAIMEVGVALALSSTAVLVFLRIARRAVESASADTADVQAAAVAVTAIGTQLLRDMALAGLLYGLVIAGFAGLLGSSRFATWLRELLAPVLVGKPVGSWLSAIGLLLLLLYVLPGEQLQPWWRGVVFIALFAAALGSLRQQLAKEFPDASLTDSWDVLTSGIGNLRSPSDN
jgi:hypothetical protein